MVKYRMFYNTVRVAIKMGTLRCVLFTKFLSLLHVLRIEAVVVKTLSQTPGNRARDGVEGFQDRVRKVGEVNLQVMP